jgi:DNA-directed RNA polymerase subunit M/transcription elongation factor TFIIS
MPIEFTCPECAHNLHVPDEYAGRNARCKKCGAAILIPESIDAALAVLYEEVSPAKEKLEWHEDHLAEDTVQESDQENEVACPKCHEHFCVELQGLEPDGNLRIACDHCGTEKKLSAFQKEYQRKILKAQKQRESRAAERRKAEDAAKNSFALEQLQSTAKGNQVGLDSTLSRDGEIAFEGKYTPNIQLLPGEHVCDVFEAGIWDLGLFGWIFGYKRRMVLTSHRLFSFQKKIIDNLLEVVWLNRTKAIVVGQELSGTQFTLGLIMLIGVLFQNLAYWMNRSSNRLQPFHDSWLLTIILFFLEIGVCLLIIVYSRRKVMRLSTGEDKIGIKLTRINTDESKRFVEKVFAIVSTNEPMRPGEEHTS